jgi:hypothetical protein
VRKRIKMRKRSLRFYTSRGNLNSTPSVRENPPALRPGENYPDGAGFVSDSRHKRS